MYRIVLNKTSYFGTGRCPVIETIKSLSLSIRPLQRLRETGVREQNIPSVAAFGDLHTGGNLYQTAY